MELDEFASRLDSTGLPNTYNAWPPGEAPALPFICYRSTGSNNLHADGGVYYSGSSIEAELLTKNKDPTVEKLVENALTGIHWEKSETYIESQRCFQILYEIEV